MKILVVEASGLHLGYVGCYGNDWVATPNLDRLAADSIVFDQHLADPEPLVVPDGRVRRERIPALATFGKQAIERIGKTAEPVLWIDGPALEPPWRLPVDLLTTYADEEEAAEPFAEPPLGIVPLELDDLDRLQSTYAAVLTYFDAQLGRILDWLRERDELDRVLVCVTARCGLPLGEHGLIGPLRAWLHDELVHVPLILRLPGAAEAGRRVPAFTQPIDMMPTLCEHLGLAAPTGHGRSLWPLIRGEVTEVRPYAVSRGRVGDGEEWLLRTTERALLLPIAMPAGDVPRQVQLYVKPDDRWEVNDLALRYEEEARQLEQVLRAFMAASERPGALEYPPLPDEAPTAPEEGP
jgi:arylsulfatase A-like enzyme